VRNIVQTLCQVAHVHEHNILELSKLRGQVGDVCLLTNSVAWVGKSEQRGQWLLVIGFVLLALGNAAIVLSLFTETVA